MNILMMTDEQILELGCKALVEKLGPIGMIRFIHQFEAGTGNYTEDRYQWIDVSDVETLAKQIQQEENNAEFAFKAPSPVIEQNTDDAQNENISIEIWSDPQEEEITRVDSEIEDVDQSSIPSFHIRNQIQEFAYPA